VNDWWYTSVGAFELSQFKFLYLKNSKKRRCFDDKTTIHNKVSHKRWILDTGVYIPHQLQYANTECLGGTQQLALLVMWQLIELLDVKDTWNWGMPPPHAMHATCHASEQTATIHSQ
jgi:hypothetical protein